MMKINDDDNQDDIDDDLGDDKDDDEGGDEVDIISDNLQWLQHHDLLMIIYSQMRSLPGRQVSEKSIVCVH